MAPITETGVWSPIYLAAFIANDLLGVGWYADPFTGHGKRKINSQYFAR